MNSPDVRNAIQIDRGSSLAISNEIADRLRIKLRGEHDPLPRHLKALVERIAQISSHSNQARGGGGGGGGGREEGEGGARDDLRIGSSMLDFSNASFTPETIGMMKTALDTAVASLPAPVSSAHVRSIAKRFFARRRKASETPLSWSAWR